MATCAHCKTQETDLFDNGVPICIACATNKDAKAKPMERATAYGKMGKMPDDLKRTG
jgi:hypothetical protein